VVISPLPEIQLSGRERYTKMVSVKHTNVRVKPAVRVTALWMESSLTYPTHIVHTESIPPPPIIAFDA